MSVQLHLWHVLILATLLAIVWAGYVSDGHPIGCAMVGGVVLVAILSTWLVYFAACYFFRL